MICQRSFENFMRALKRQEINTGGHLKQILQRGRDIFPFDRALLQLGGDFGRDIPRPSFGVVEGHDAHGISVASVQEVADHHLAIGIRSASDLALGTT